MIITTFFNPASYKRPLQNYIRFSNELKKQKIKLTTIELAFDGASFQIDGSIKLRSNSVMWQKERLINFAMQNITSNTDYVVWLDCDILFKDKYWLRNTLKELEHSDIIQPYSQVMFLNNKGNSNTTLDSIAYQYKTTERWYENRCKGKLGFGHHGFAWAARRTLLTNLGLYDKNIVGGGDTFLVDCLLHTFEFHHYYPLYPGQLRWYNQFKATRPKFGYADNKISHLWHGNTCNRQYGSRHDILIKNNFNEKDIALRDHVYEWATAKPELHRQIKNYFFSRKEDSDVSINTDNVFSGPGYQTTTSNKSI